MLVLVGRSSVDVTPSFVTDLHRPKGRTTISLQILKETQKILLSISSFWVYHSVRQQLYKKSELILDSKLHHPPGPSCCLRTIKHAAPAPNPCFATSTKLCTLWQLATAAKMGHRGWVAISLTSLVDKQWMVRKKNAKSLLAQLDWTCRPRGEQLVSLHSKW